VAEYVVTDDAHFKTLGVKTKWIWFGKLHKRETWCSRRVAYLLGFLRKKSKCGCGDSDFVPVEYKVPIAVSAWLWGIVGLS